LSFKSRNRFNVRITDTRDLCCLTLAGGNLVAEQTRCLCKVHLCLRELALERLSLHLKLCHSLLVQRLHACQVLDLARGNVHLALSCLQGALLLLK
jgi:hypothetical protein